ncbi:MAG: glycosyltransferase family 2 protein [Chthoniobacterales bacterium]
MVTRIFGEGRFLFVGGDRDAIERQFAGRVEATTFFQSVSELMANPAKNSSAGHFDVAIWFVQRPNIDFASAAEHLAKRADELVLISGEGAELAKHRPELVRVFRERGLVPDYSCDFSAIDPAAVRLVREPFDDSDEIVPAVERTVARLNLQMHGLQRTLRTRMSELEAADQHIERLEEKLLKLKEAKRELKKLKAEKQALRKSPERKIGQVLLAPYRLPQKLVREVRKRLQRANESRSSLTTEYHQWFERHRVTPEQAAALREEVRQFNYQPFISIITPVFNTPIAWLEDAIRSVREQIYEQWELVLIDDGSTNSDLLKLLNELPAQDSRIIVEKLPTNSGISVASNRGLDVAGGHWIGFLDHDDVLEPDALFQNVKWLQEHPGVDLIYSDEDKLTEEGFDSPIFKPDWSPDFFCSCNYLGHFTLICASLLKQLDGFHSQFDGAQDYDLFFRVVERTQRIHHIPRVLYHWRRSSTSTADNIRRKPGLLETGRLAVEAHLRRVGEPGHVSVDWRTHAYWIKRDLPEAKRISIIIPVRDRIDLLSRCIDSLTRTTAYPNYEIVIVDNDSQSAEAREYFSSTKHRLLRYSGPFNYSAINNFGVEQTDSPWLLFLNSDVEAIHDDWLTTMAEHAQRRDVGAVGPRLLYPDDTVQHAGIVVGVGGIAEHAFRGLPAEAPGVCRQLQVTRNYSSVTGACLMTRREVFEEVGGFDEERLPVTFSDVDLCLKMRRAGYLIVYTPFAKLYHHESGTRRPSVEPMATSVMQQRWPDLLAYDPYYNPNLSRERADFSLGE